MKYEHLFSPIKIRGMELKNRVMIPGMATKMADNRHMTQRFIDYQTARAEGGLGLNFVEATSIHEPSAPDIFFSLGDDQYIEGFKALTDSIHAAGGKVGVQLWQGGLVAAVLDPSVTDLVMPSDMEMAVTVVSGSDSGVMKVPGATKEKIAEVVEAFGEGARRAVEAGFDCVEFHAAHGYSPHVFLSSAFNHREDEYGGSLENRARFSLECIDAIRANIPEDMPLFIRVDAQDDNLGHEGLTIEEIIEFLNLAKERGVDAVNVSRGNPFTAGHLEGPSGDVPAGFNVANAARIKKETGLITIAVGRIYDPQQAEDIIASEQVDMVVMGRANIADPEFCNKASSGNDVAIARCMGCNHGCNDIIAAADYTDHITCLINPAVGREAEFVVKQTAAPKKVLVVGGGIAGIEAAIMLQQRGHQPVIVEKNDSLGGLFKLAGSLTRNAEYKTTVETRAAYAKELGVEIRTGTKCTPEVLADIAPDYVIIAAGSSEGTSDIPGADAANVYYFADILSGAAKAEGATVVIGGGLVGVGTAEYLAELGNAVTLIEAGEDIAFGMGDMRKAVVLPLMAEAGIVSITGATAKEIASGKVVIETSDGVQEIACDSVVLANNQVSTCTCAIKEACDEKGIPYAVVGDAKEVREAMSAVAEAADAVLALDA